MSRCMANCMAMRRKTCALKYANSLAYSKCDSIAFCTCMVEVAYTSDVSHSDVDEVVVGDVFMCLSYWGLVMLESFEEGGELLEYL